MESPHHLEGGHWVGVQELEEQSGGRSQRPEEQWTEGGQGSLYDPYGFHPLLIIHQRIH